MSLTFWRMRILSPSTSRYRLRSGSGMCAASLTGYSPFLAVANAAGSMSVPMTVGNMVPAPRRSIASSTDIASEYGS
ncbi:MAG TPA: hypothetical protein DCP20_09205 [Coriobacteriia bacterium]|nr:hypothetical protein [Coriobacteriia bacterium]